jgi:sulfide:quinone oxidoreductase
MKRVLIIGGGSGATFLANTLDRRQFETTVVSASVLHMFQPGLLYVAFKNAPAGITRAERRLLPRHVHFVQQDVTHVDLREHRVRTQAGRELTYDEVVLATGVQTAAARIPGLEEVNAQFGDYHSTIEQAQKVWRHLAEVRGGTIVIGQGAAICKCPPSPLEGALLAEEFLRERGLKSRVKLVYFTPYPRPYAAEGINDIVAPILRERGIEVRTFFDLDRVDTANRTIHSIEGEQIPYDVAFIVPPFIGAPITYEPAEVLDEDRLIITDKFSLRVKGVESAFAIGDATNLPTSKAGVGAHLEAKVVARALAAKPARFDGRTHCPMDLAYGKGTFVIGSYAAPTVKYAPSRLNHWMKAAMARIYWISLRGWLDPLFDVYFRLTAPEKLAARQAHRLRPAA